MTDISATNIALAKRAWSHLIEREYGEPPCDRSGSGGSKTLYDYLDEEIEWKFAVPEDTPVYGGTFRGKQAVRELGRLDREENVESGGLDGPPEFFAEGNRVVMLMKENYRIRKNYFHVRHKDCAVVMDFRDGLIIRVLVIQDQSEWNAAHRSDQQP